MALKVGSVTDDFKVNSLDTVRVKEMGNIVELMYSEHSNSKIVIKKINNNEYIDLRTGEIKEFTKLENRACDLNSVRQSLGKLRDLLNTNITDVRNCKWVTLTYKENMTDSKQLYEDFKNFNKRMRYFLSKQGYKYEYIVAMEPQGRGAWHAHIVMIFDTKAPYIDNEVMSDIWGNGFTVTKKLDKNIDNLGAYLTAYLGDMDLVDFHSLSDEEKNNMKVYDVREIEINEGDEKVSKAIIKGGRLHMYPPKFNLYRCSRGIKKPIITYEREIEAQKKISAGTLTFERTIK
ncbi:MAG: hypothetical protein RR657_07770, partial [Peptostreptococcaceae bacterium]